MALSSRTLITVKLAVIPGIVCPVFMLITCTQYVVPGIGVPSANTVCQLNFHSFLLAS